MENSVLDWLTLALAAMGFALGVVNYLTDLFRRRPRAIVAVRNRYTPARVHIGLGVAVENKGEVPFTVSKVFFELRGGKNHLYASFERGDVLPKVLHPGEHCEVVFARGSYLDDAGVSDVVRITVSTPAGTEFHSKKLAHRFVEAPLQWAGKETCPRTIELPVA